MLNIVELPINKKKHDGITILIDVEVLSSPKLFTLHRYKAPKARATPMKIRNNPRINPFSNVKKQINFSNFKLEFKKP